MASINVDALVIGAGPGGYHAAIRLGQLGKKVGILNPHKNPSRALLPHIDFIKQIRAGVLQASQFSPVLTDRHGTFTKPAAW